MTEELLARIETQRMRIADLRLQLAYAQQDARREKRRKEALAALLGDDDDGDVDWIRCKMIGCEMRETPRAGASPKCPNDHFMCHMCVEDFKEAIMPECELCLRDEERLERRLKRRRQVTRN